jgi:two-component system chemotaxis response regulator CheB
VDVLFSSVARAYVNRSLAVIMTGMGKDGAVEIGTIYREGGTTLAQDEASSVVFGMPRAAIESGVITEIVPLSGMAETINRLSREHPRG